jgi:hypothetical protein
MISHALQTARKMKRSNKNETSRITSHGWEKRNLCNFPHVFFPANCVCYGGPAVFLLFPWVIFTHWCPSRLRANVKIYYRGRPFGRSYSVLRVQLTVTTREAIPGGPAQLACSLPWRCFLPSRKSRNISVALRVRILLWTNSKYK